MSKHFKLTDIPSGSKHQQSDSRPTMTLQQPFLFSFSFVSAQNDVPIWLWMWMPHNVCIWPSHELVNRSYINQQDNTFELNNKFWLPSSARIRPQLWKHFLLGFLGLQLQIFRIRIDTTNIIFMVVSLMAISDVDRSHIAVTQNSSCTEWLYAAITITWTASHTINIAAIQIESTWHKCI